MNIDVPDVVQRMTGVSISNAASGVSVTFPKPFTASPSIVANLADGSIGYCVVVGKTPTTAIIKAYNSAGTTITGTIDIQLVGY